MKFMRVGWVLVCLLVVVTPLAAATPPPVVNNALSGWEWWREGDTFILLPLDAGPGPQARFVLVMPGGDQADAWLPAWFGGGEVVWQGELRAQDVAWAGRLAQGNGYRGLLARTADGMWSAALMSPVSQWHAHAPLYNALLKGATP